MVSLSTLIKQMNGAKKSFPKSMKPSAATVATAGIIKIRNRLPEPYVSNRLMSSSNAVFAKCSRISSTDHGSFSLFD